MAGNSNHVQSIPVSTGRRYEILTVGAERELDPPQGEPASGSAAAPSARPLLIRVTAGVDEGLEIELSGGEVRVGTAVDNELILTDASVAPRHCALRLEGEGLRVRMCDPGKAVWLVGSRVFDAQIGDFPALLQLGDTELTVSCPASALDELSDGNRFGRLVGDSFRMRLLFAELQRFASCDVNVLVEGEAGTGKTLAAKAIHEHSRRRGRAFVVFDCSAPTAEAHLLGEQANTLPEGRRLLEQAAGGSIFLKHPGDLPRELQPLLLQALHLHAATRSSDVRILAASTQRLESQASRKSFVEELRVRLSAEHIVVPPLRARLDDIRRLVEYFVLKRDSRLPVQELSEHVWRLLAAYHWPGNVRELELAIEPWLACGSQPAVMKWQPEGRSSALQRLREDRPTPLREARQEAVDAFEKEYLRLVLARANGNVTRAAASIEISRQMFHKLLRKHTASSSC